MSDRILKRAGPTHWVGTLAGYTIHLSRLSPGWYVWIMAGVPPSCTQVVLRCESPKDGVRRAREWIERQSAAG
ncbi:MAG TPA: hypothetical protein VH120_05270 [Gemmataceae bacterium]|nr:hypothetical protein [Gemmataceae bacterium]